MPAPRPARPQLARRHRPPRLRPVVLRRPLPGTLCRSATRGIPEGRKGRRWLRQPCAMRPAPRRSHEKTSVAPDRTARQHPDAQPAALRHPCSRIALTGSPPPWRRPCGPGVVSCRFDARALPGVPQGRSQSRSNLASRDGSRVAPRRVSELWPGRERMASRQAMNNCRAVAAGMVPAVPSLTAGSTATGSSPSRHMRRSQHPAGKNPIQADPNRRIPDTHEAPPPGQGMRPCPTPTGTRGLALPQKIGERDNHGIVFALRVPATRIRS